MLDRDALFAAAANGDVATIKRFFHQLSLRPSIDRVNQYLLHHHDAALAQDKSPFTMSHVGPRPHDWYAISGGRFRNIELRRWLFDVPAERGHLAVFAWFFGPDGVQIFGDSIRPLCGIMYHSARCMSTIVNAELVELMLSSCAIEAMSPSEQAFLVDMILQDAIQRGQSDLIRLLVAHAADIDTPSTMRLTAEHGGEDTLQAIVESGAVCSLHQQLINTEDPSLTRALIRHGMDARAEDGDYAALHIAIPGGNAEMAHILITEGFADVNVQSRQGMTPLMYAAAKDPTDLVDGELDILLTLLQYGADVNLRDDRGETALHMAACVKTLSTLLAHGADPNARDNDGGTVFHNLTAQILDDDSIVEDLDVLLSYQADPHIKTTSGESAYSLLMQSERGQSYVTSRAQYFNRD
ncbi:hypothetical protein Poli38472_009349 [Pythium oligandrum]|uniref:Ankyrin repeat protein n=1 Tax=Pythium oligandrum TaxID=41045 RepID=A0A8K1CKK2_PYTOL|nr:hypothetical protein Poli38472_009349 [Pythium oligandrum]|eukprot:TMW65182.1 hypothetical protein Poli38472_009349 [Pythium oligandrum]